VKCECLGIQAPFEGVCFGHALFKAWQYTTFDENVNFRLQPMNIKATKSSIQSYITWPNFFGKGRVWGQMLVWK
jgi:hypothetical protein